MIPKNNSEWIDVTVSIENNMVHWPGDPAVEVRRLLSIRDGAIANVTGLNMGAHIGTHIDAPCHFIEGGKDVTQWPLEVLMGKAKVFYIHNNHQITLNDIKDLPIEKGDRILFKTRNSESAWSMEAFKNDYVFLATEAAIFLSDIHVSCVGIDYLSIGGHDNETEVHQTLLRKEICIIEGLDLRKTGPGEYDMICLPLKIKGSDGAPARVILRKRSIAR